MSTKMSTDMHLNRPSSRVLAAPGGGSSISLGGDDTTQINTAPHSRHVKGGADTINLGSSNEPPAPVHSRRHTSGGSDTIDLGDGSVPPPPAPSAGITADTSVAADTVEEGEEEGEQPRVGILVGGELAAEELTSAITKALRRAGVTPAAATVMARVEDVAVLPYAAQNMLQGCDVLLVSAVLMDPVGSIAPALTSTMLSMALGGTVPIIPGFVVQKSLLEAKALLGENAAKWAKSVALMLKLQAGGTVNVAPAPEPVIEEVPVHTPEVDDVSTLLAIFRESLKSKGARSFAGLQRKFKIIDDDGSGKIDIAEFTKAVKEHALGWTVGQIQQVFDHFDTDKSKNIDFDEFIVGVRGHLNDRRRQLVLMAFQLLDADHSGTVELNDIEAKYDASQHPDVIAGKKSESEVLSEFLDTFDTMEKDGKVSTEEFCKYYANLSASIDEDDYFELMIRNAWHISGGEGWCANSSCRRVAVIHVDGSQTVEEIKNDLGIGADDKDKMFQNLLDQGITDMEYIQLNDGSKYHPANYKVQKPAAAAPATPPRSSAAAAAAAVVEAAAAQKEAPKAAGSPTKPKKDITQTAPASAASGAAQNRRRAPGGASSIIFG